MNITVRLDPGGFCDGKNWQDRHVIHSFSLGHSAMVCTNCGNVCDIDNNVVRKATAEDLKRPPGYEEFEAQLAEYRAEIKRLEKAGTPYWCTHKGREVDHPAAYWKEDGYESHDKAKIHRKHGVMCRDCGGYIQEG